MTPAELYAQKRIEAESLIRTHAPQRLQDALIDLLRPAIALSATRFVDEEIPVGASKFGGAPDVPADFVWPTWNQKPLGFLAQINLEEVAPFDVEKRLPQSGVLSFFYDLNKFPWGYDPTEKEGWRVIWIENPIERATVAKSFTAHLLNFEAHWTIPSWENEEISSILRDSDKEIWQQFEIMRTEMTFANQMFGWPDVIQNPMEGQCQLASHDIYCGDERPYATARAQELKLGASDWILLAQLQMEDDDGLLYYWIRKQDLAVRDFSKAWLCYQCT